METTLAIIKPDAYKKGYAGKIIDRIIQEGFDIKNMKQVLLSKEKYGCLLCHSGWNVMVNDWHRNKIN